MDLSLIYNDPGHQMLAQRMGMNMQTYVGNMDPRALQANIANLSRGPRPNGPTMDEAYNGRRVGANSGNAFTSSSPTTVGMLGNPTQPPNPAENHRGVLNTSPVAPIQRNTDPAVLTQPEQSDMLPGGRPELFEPRFPGDIPPSLKPTEAVLTSGGAVVEPGALTQGTNTATANTAATNTAASSGGAPRPNSGASSGLRKTPTNNTGNARNSGMPDMRIGRMAQIGRMGTAMLGSAGDGLLASMAAGGDAMYAVNDANRAAEMAEYENSERLRLEKAKLAALAARGGSGGRGGKGGASNPYGSVGAQAAQFNTIIAALKSDPNMTGPIAGSLGQMRDRAGYGDASRADLRLQMEGIALNEQLLYTAQTKGAITDREMAMFRAPIPRITDDEAVWVAWLEPRAAVLNQLANNGVSDAARAAGGQATGSAPAFNAEDYTVVEIPDPKG